MEFIDFNDLEGQEICIIKNKSSINICGNILSSPWYDYAHFIYYNHNSYYIDNEIPPDSLSRIRGSGFEWYRKNYTTILIGDKPYITTFKNRIRLLINKQFKDIDSDKINGIYITPTYIKRDFMGMSMSDYSTTKVNKITKDMNLDFSNEKFIVDTLYFMDNERLTKEVRSRLPEILNIVTEKRINNLLYV
jgi:hypothetical protein